MTITLITPTPSAAAPYSGALASAGERVCSGRFASEIGCVAVVAATGRLNLLEASNAVTPAAMRRRTVTGLVHGIDLPAGITCWVDGDQQDGSGEPNDTATRMCLELSGGMFAGPDDAPFVCGPVLFTGSTGQRLSDEQVARIIDARATAYRTAVETVPDAAVDGVDADLSWDW
jgi:hypothetical protein